MKEIIIDVRTVEEWNEGHAPCSINVPLDTIAERATEFLEYDLVTIVCRSGARASNAQAILQSVGVKNIENKGPWKSISCS